MVEWGFRGVGCAGCLVKVFGRERERDGRQAGANAFGSGTGLYTSKRRAWTGNMRRRRACVVSGGSHGGEREA